MVHLTSGYARSLCSPPSNYGGEVARAERVTERGTMAQDVAVPAGARSAAFLPARYLKLHHRPALRHGLRPVLRTLSPNIRLGRGQGRGQPFTGLPCC